MMNASRQEQAWRFFFSFANPYNSSRAESEFSALRNGNEMICHSFAARYLDFAAPGSRAPELDVSTCRTAGAFYLGPIFSKCESRQILASPGLVLAVASVFNRS